MWSAQSDRVSLDRRPLDILPNHGELGILFDDVPGWQARIAPVFQRGRACIDSRRSICGRMETTRVVAAHAQSIQTVARNKMTRMRRRPRLRSPHRTADRDDKRSQAGYAGGDDDDVGFHPGEKSESEAAARGGEMKEILTPPTAKSRPRDLGHRALAARATFHTR